MRDFVTSSKIPEINFGYFTSADSITRYTVLMAVDLYSKHGVENFIPYIHRPRLTSKTDHVAVLFSSRGNCKKVSFPMKSIGLTWDYCQSIDSSNTLRAALTILISGWMDPCNWQVLLSGDSEECPTGGTDRTVRSHTVPHSYTHTPNVALHYGKRKKADVENSPLC